MLNFSCFVLIFISSCVVSAQANPSSDLSDLLQKARAGDSQAQFELGLAYEDGKGIPQNDETAATWYRKSADQGNARGQNALGTLYSAGRGVPRDKEEALRWYHKAALQELPEADFNIAIRRSGFAAQWF